MLQCIPRAEANSIYTSFSECFRPVMGGISVENVGKIDAKSHSNRDFFKGG
jgi:hypothetical protein